MRKYWASSFKLLTPPIKSMWLIYWVRYWQICAIRWRRSKRTVKSITNRLVRLRNIDKLTTTHLHSRPSLMPWRMGHRSTLRVNWTFSQNHQAETPRNRPSSQTRSRGLRGHHRYLPSLFQWQVRNEDRDVDIAVWPCGTFGVGGRSLVIDG